VDSCGHDVLMKRQAPQKRSFQRVGHALEGEASAMRWNIFKRRQRRELEATPVIPSNVEPTSTVAAAPSPLAGGDAGTGQRQLAARFRQMPPYVPAYGSAQPAFDLDALFGQTPTMPVKLVDKVASDSPEPTVNSTAFEDDWDDVLPSADEDSYTGVQPPSYSPITLTTTPLCDDGRLGVVGESFYQEALQIVTGGRSFGTSFDDHLPVTAVLVPEPENPYDLNAVRIDVLCDAMSLKVGYLATENAERYQPFLLELEEEGRVGTCPARVCGGGPDRSYGIYLHIAPPESILAPPPIGPDASFARVLDGEIVLKPEWSCTVTREEDHQEDLLPFAPRDGEDYASVRATLTFCEVSRGKYRGQRAIEVRLGGARVGELTMAMTQRYAELVEGKHSEFPSVDGRAGCQGMPADAGRRR
jgi:hypothetical protein